MKICHTAGFFHLSRFGWSLWRTHQASRAIGTSTRAEIFSAPHLKIIEHDFLSFKFSSNLATFRTEWVGMCSLGGKTSRAFPAFKKQFRSMWLSHDSKNYKFIFSERKTLLPGKVLGLETSVGVAIGTVTDHFDVHLKTFNICEKIS